MILKEFFFKNGKITKSVLKAQPTKIFDKYFTNKNKTFVLSVVKVFVFELFITEGL